MTTTAGAAASAGRTQTELCKGEDAGRDCDAGVDCRQRPIRFVLRIYCVGLVVVVVFGELALCLRRNELTFCLNIRLAVVSERNQHLLFGLWAFCAPGTHILLFNAQHTRHIHSLYGQNSPHFALSHSSLTSFPIQLEKLIPLPLYGYFFSRIFIT